MMLVQVSEILTLNPHKLVKIFCHVELLNKTQSGGAIPELLGRARCLQSPLSRISLASYLPARSFPIHLAD